MNLLLGIPRILVTLILLGIRLAPLILVAIVVIYFYRKSKGGGDADPPKTAEKAPHFDGPVHTVEWREAEEPEPADSPDAAGADDAPAEGADDE